MIHEGLNEQISQLVDGELTSDGANRVLLKALPNKDHRLAMLRMLRLRHALASWRNQGVESDEYKPIHRTVSPQSQFRNALIGMAAILVVSVSALIYLASVQGERGLQTPGLVGPGVRSGVKSISRDDAARILSLHESITGPVAWLAILPESVQVQKLNQAGDGMQADDTRAIVCFLNIESRGSEFFPTTPDLIICRMDRKATLTIPSSGKPSKSMQIQLVALHRDGSLGIQYAISLEDTPASDMQTSTLTGFIPLSGDARTLGQLANSGTVLDVALSASLLAATG
ncbi:MAG: hypothetical protein DHS20C16_12770 [Phycisphaerae bacterium]|nr:MAG: hypothetical protein DHS20C16_12770 [Phycisphaerae bacterium]